MKLYTIVLFFVCAIPFVAQTQTISNVTAKQESDNIIITYTLQAEKEQYIELLLSKDGGKTFGEKPLDNLSGDVGLVTAGTNKKAIWNATKSESVLSGNNFVFRVQINSKATSFANYTETTAGVSFDMIAVKGGTFNMGSAENNDEQPIHDVTLSNFYIGKYEVTQAQWKVVMGTNPSKFKGDNLPVEQVSWDDVQEFIKKLNDATGKKYSLPTEAQWEYAAGGGANNYTKYAGTNNENELGDYAWYDKNSNGITHEIGIKKPNQLGIYDMSGNVWEWCMDWYDSGYYKNSPQKNPVNLTQASARVFRGGGWSNYASYCRVALRDYDYPYDGSNLLGFRLVALP